MDNKESVPPVNATFAEHIKYIKADLLAASSDEKIKLLDTIDEYYARHSKRLLLERAKLITIRRELRLYRDELLSEQNGIVSDKNILSCLNPKKADPSIIKDHSQQIL